jgi:HEAT repeat protein
MKNHLIQRFRHPIHSIILAISTLILLFGTSYCMHAYIDQTCGSTTLAFLILIFWLFLCLCVALILVLAFSERLIYAGYLDELFKDEMAEIVSQLDGLKPSSSEVTEQDLIKLQVNANLRFTLQMILFTLICVLGTNAMSDGFLGRFHSSGWALVGLRSDVPLKRLQSIEHLLEIPKKFELQPALRDAIINKLSDIDEGVQARAIFACGQFDIEACIEPLSKITKDSPLFRKEALLALGRIKIKTMQVHHIDHLLLAFSQDEQLRQSEPQALLYALGAQRLLKAQNAIISLYEKTRLLLPNTEGSQLEQGHLKTVLMALWALGEFRDPKLLAFFEKTIQDSNLQIRCATAYALEKIVQFESSPILQKAFAVSKKTDQCEQLLSDIQIGGKAEILLPARTYQLNLARALATTDDPDLLAWMIKHQEEMELMTRKLMHKYYQALEIKDKQGLLEGFKQRNRLKQEKKDSRSPEQMPQDQSPTILNPDPMHP